MHPALPRFLEGVRTSLCAHVSVELQKPFHTPLHLCDALERVLDLSKHVKSYAPRGGLDVREQFHFHEGGMLMRAKAPSYVSIAPTESRGTTHGASGRRVTLRVTFGSPERLMFDALMAAVLIAASLVAFASGTAAIGALFLFCLCLGLTPSLVLEAKSRRLFRLALRESTAEANEAMARMGSSAA